MRNRRSNYGASVRFCATVLSVSATQRNEASSLIGWRGGCGRSEVACSGMFKVLHSSAWYCTVLRVGASVKKSYNLSKLGPQKCYNSGKSAEVTAEESSSSH